jgi:hypothetical protein
MTLAARPTSLNAPSAFERLPWLKKSKTSTRMTNLKRPERSIEPIVLGARWTKDCNRALRIVHTLPKPSAQNTLGDIDVARRLRNGDTPLLDQLYRLEPEGAAEFSALHPRSPIRVGNLNSVSSKPAAAQF